MLCASDPATPVRSLQGVTEAFGYAKIARRYASYASYAQFAMMRESRCVCFDESTKANDIRRGED